MFPTARWKAYVRNLQASQDETGTPPDVVYHILHAERLWFTQDIDNGHQKSAEEHLKRCDSLLEECKTIVDDLNDTLANTPKPSEAIDWNAPWW